VNWKCSSCGQEFSGPCFHDCGLPKPKPAKSPLARVRNPQGRVDVLLAQLLEKGFQQAKNPVLPALYQDIKPLVEQVLKNELGPRTRRGRKIAAHLFDLASAYQKVQQKQRGAA